ncbi:MAG: carboxypeptidase-like regulatory domain-containing protein [Acidobacteria bacterium]|nr:carboxypeptidase-like regulatory domain-containing protein [Acidobacteriota bacterium]MCI0717485.1 carboxypeptidase-like regulatory domain-containing protein [Acidobacteriota bacterium]
MPARKFPSISRLALFLAAVCPKLDAAEIFGRVMDADTGQSLGGAIIRAIPLARSQRQVQATSQSDGTYQFDLVRGKYRLFASLPNSDYLSQFFSASGEPRGDVIDVATFASFRIIDLKLPAGGSITGTVLRTADLAPVGNLRVYAFSQSFRASAQTSGDGTYRFRALPPGTYKVQALPLDENFVPVYYGGVRDADKSAGITIMRRQAVANIDFRLRYGGIISGRVYANRNREPIAGLKIVAENQNRQEPPYFTQTDAQGFYTLRGLTEGAYTVETAPGRESSAQRSRRYLKQFHEGRFDPELADRLEIETGSVFTGINFSLFEGASISGTVRSRHHNRPLPNVTLLFQNIDRTVVNPFQATTGPEGEFLVSDLAPGSYWVETALPARIQRLVNLFYREKLSSAKADLITLEEGERARHIDFNLPLGGTIRGGLQIEDPEYALKPAGKAVSLARRGADLDGFGKRSFKLRPDGSFIIERTPPGRYSLSPVLDDPNLVLPVNSQEKTLEMTEGDLIEGIEFPLRVVGSIAGTISSENNLVKLEGLTLLLVNLKDNTKSFFDLPAEQYTIAGVEPGKYFMVLLTKSGPSPPAAGLPTAVIYDTRVVEVQKGKTASGTNLQVPPDLNRKPGMFP